MYTWLNLESYANGVHHFVLLHHCLPRCELEASVGSSRSDSRQMSLLWFSSDSKSCSIHSSWISNSDAEYMSTYMSTK